MDVIGTVAWVNRNLNRFNRRIAICRVYSPFEERDYMQEAHLAAIDAAMRSRKKGISFESAFWICFRELSARMTPNPGSGSPGSKSIPSNLCVSDVNLAEIRMPEKKREPDIDGIFQAVQGYLTKREQRVLCMALGMTYEGSMSNHEIATCLGCGESNVRDVLKRAIERIRSLVKQGKIRPDDFR